MTTIDKAKTGQQIRLLMEKRGVTVRDVRPEHAHIGQSLCLKRSAEGADGYAGLRKPAL